MAAVDRPHAQRQRAILTHGIAAQVPAVEFTGKALGISSGGFCPHYTCAPCVVQRPIGTQQQALCAVFQAGATALAVEAAIVAQALEPEVAIVVVGQRAKGGQQLVAQVLRGVLGRGGKVGILAASQLFEAAPIPPGALASSSLNFSRALICSDVSSPDCNKRWSAGSSTLATWRPLWVVACLVR